MRSGVKDCNISIMPPAGWLEYRVGQLNS
jgi:hypothetical protein